MIIVVFGRFDSCFAGVNDKIYVKISVHELRLVVSTQVLEIHVYLFCKKYSRFRCGIQEKLFGDRQTSALSEEIDQITSS